MSYWYDLRKKSLTIVLMLLWDRSLSSISFNYFSILFHDSTALRGIEYFPCVFVFAYKKVSYMRLPCLELEAHSYVDPRKN